MLLQSFLARSRPTNTGIAACAAGSITLVIDKGVLRRKRMSALAMGYSRQFGFPCSMGFGQSESRIATAGIFGRRHRLQMPRIATGTMGTCIAHATGSRMTDMVQLHPFWNTAKSQCIGQSVGSLFSPALSFRIPDIQVSIALGGFASSPGPTDIRSPRAIYFVPEAFCEGQLTMPNRAVGKRIAMFTPAVVMGFTPVAGQHWEITARNTTGLHGQPLHRLKRDAWARSGVAPRLARVSKTLPSHESIAQL